MLTDQSFKIPKCNEGRNMKGPAIPTKIADEFVRWLQKTKNIGLHGDPISWKKHT